jgi:hypothetical protein
MLRRRDPLPARSTMGGFCCGSTRNVAPTADHDGAAQRPGAARLRRRLSRLIGDLTLQNLDRNGGRAWPNSPPHRCGLRPRRLLSVCPSRDWKLQQSIRNRRQFKLLRDQRISGILTGAQSKISSCSRGITFLITTCWLASAASAHTAKR